MKVYDKDLTGNDFILDTKDKFISDKLFVTLNLATIPRSKGGDYFYQNWFVDVEVLETKAHVLSKTVDVDVSVLKVDIPDNETKVKIGDVPKEKFDKVKVKAEEAVLYISSEIATAIVVDKDGDIVSYPDYGAYNGQDEYIEDGKIYCKEIKIGGKKKSAFPTYKMYIYRGNTKGEAVKKLKQDLKLKTHENAESTVLEIARHSKNNLNYKQSGPIPPNNIDKLYRLKYQEGTSHKKTSYRYRIVDDNAGNFPTVKDYKKEYDKGGMNLGSRSAISIDPWKSASLEGCIGIRDAGGGDNPNCKDAMKKQDAANYKYIYHSLNNYLEGLIPEMTGIFGRRGFSSTGGTVNAEASTYDQEIKVYVLANHLPDIDECGLFADNRRLYYKSFGSKTVKYMEKNSTANKFKGLYMIAQRRQENGFRLKTIGNNPMNIKGSGDAGQIAMNTHETINGKYVSVPGEKFANFTTEDAGIKGYIDLLNKNFNDAYKSLFDDAKTIDDFTAGLEDTGKKGAYATGQAQGKLSATDAYKAALKSNFNTTKKDYIKIYECLITKSTDSKIKSQLEADLELLKKLE